MIFNEIYGCYYNAVAKMIGLAVDGKLTENKMNEVALEYAFEESMLTIVPALKNQNWQLIDTNLETPLIYKPTMPMTSLEKRWLKTILLDPRVALFQVPMDELDDVEPLFEPDDIVYFDKYTDGDSYDDPKYIECFNTIRTAIKEHKKLWVKYRNSRNVEKVSVFEPIKIEYSDKEDKFRMLSVGRWDNRTINIGRIIHCKICYDDFSEELSLNSRNKEILVYDLIDENNALERVMMKFAHYRKEVERTGDNTYHVEMQYDKDDEIDVLIQMLSFGCQVNIIEPKEMRTELKARIRKQLGWLDW